MTEPWLVLETSGRGGTAAVARGGVVVRSAHLDPARRHVRDLTAVVAGLLRDEGLRPADVAAVVIGVGPGSYTGLRVGVMTAKALAYATGCALVAVPTFAAVAEQAPADAGDVWVIGDALQGSLYQQRFVRDVASGEWAAGPLGIGSTADWLAEVRAGSWVSGPGVKLVEGALPAGARVVPAADREPRADGLLRAARGLPPVTRAELFALEPLYLRGSSAEEKVKPPGERPA